VFGISFVAYHLIEFTREALRGQQNASFYSTKNKEGLLPE
jgi:hopanoid C-2 methylase